MTIVTQNNNLEIPLCFNILRTEFAFLKHESLFSTQQRFLHRINRTYIGRSTGDVFVHHCHPMGQKIHP